MHRVFVYGTLRTGASNAFRMKGATSLGKATIKARLYRVHEEFPGIILSDEERDKLTGEVFDHVSDEMLTMLDIYEGCDDGIPEEERLYRRAVVQATLEGGESVSTFAWGYIRFVDEATRIGSGDWLQEV